LHILRKHFSGLIFWALFLPLSGQLVAQTSTETAAIDSGSAAQTAGSADASGQPGQQGPELPQPGQPGSPFQVDHFWNHIGLELAGGYAPVVNSGAGYYGSGFTATVGAVYHLNARLAFLAEGQVLGQSGTVNLQGCNESTADCDSGSAASYIFSFQLSPVLYLRPRGATSPFLVGGAGYYHLGTHDACVGMTSGCDAPSDNPFNSNLVSVNAAGFNVGAGLRRQISPYRKSEIFIDARYHYIASGSSSLGQVSMLPVSLGVRW